MIRKIQAVYTFINILSLDVVLGSVISTIFFSDILQVQVRTSGLIALGFTVWMIYTADHLLDAYKLKHTASTERHRFHQKHFKVMIFLLFMMAVVVITQLFSIRKFVLIGGMMLSVFVMLYFLFQKRLLYFKELAGAVLYTAGVLIIPLSLIEDSLHTPEIILIAQFFITALINLLLFSWFDVEQDRKDERQSFAIYFGERLTFKVFMILFLINGCLLFILIINPKSLLEAEICLVLMNALLFTMVVKKNYFVNEDRYRLLGDAVFFIPLLYVLH